MSNFKKRFDELVDRADSIYDPDYVVDVLDITTKELLEAFPNKFLRNLEEFDAIFGPLDDDRP